MPNPDFRRQVIAVVLLIVGCCASVWWILKYPRHSREIIVQATDSQARRINVKPVALRDPNATSEHISGGGGATAVSLVGKDDILGQQLLVEVEDLARDATYELPERVFDYAGVLRLDTVGFGKSDDATVQKIIGGYNQSQSRVEYIEIAGTYDIHDMADGRHDFTLEFVRGEGKSLIVSEHGTCAVRGHIASYSSQMNDNVDLYINSLFEVFDPSEVRAGQDSMLTVGAEDGSKKTVAVRTMTSENAKLFFGHENGILYRIDRKRPEATIAFDRYTALDGLFIPTLITVTTSITHHNNIPDGHKEYPGFTIRLDPQSVRVTHGE